jgi:hypothetical protein
MFHSFMEHLYLSGCKDGVDTGDWDVDYAINAMEVCREEVRDGYKEPSECDKDFDAMMLLGRYYVDEYGLGAANPDWPRYQVAFDGEGQPLIEREFRLDMDYNDFYVTSKPDMIMTRDGDLMTRDHKTAARGWGARRANNLDTDPQFTMEYMIMADLFPDVAFCGAEANIVVKGLKHGTDAQRFYRNSTTRSLTDIRVFKADTIDLLRRIDESVQNFKDLLERTGDIEVAASLAFPRHGVRTDACHAFNRECSFFNLCVHKDNIGRNLNAFKPRRVARAEVKINGEWQ